MIVDFLCSFHGSILFFDETNALLRHGTGAVPRNAGLVIDGERGWLVCRSGGEWRRLDGFSASGHIGLAQPGVVPLVFHIRRLADGLMTLEANGLSVCAESDGTITLSRQIQGPWEIFAPISKAEFDFLHDVHEQTWLTSDGAQIVGAEGIRIAANFRAVIGERNVPLRTLLTARHRRDQDGWSIIYEAWKVERLTAFQPLIYMIAYGKPEIFETLAIALQGLQEFGRYTGDILIFTDRSVDQLHVPSGMERQVRVATMPTHDVLDMMAAKYRICEMPELAAYRPLLYLDADVVCNLPLDDLLRELLHANRICVALEHDLLGNHNFYGATLFAADGSAAQRNERGFSAGLMGIPNVEIARRTFPVILDSLYGLARSLGTRQIFPVYDQPVTNYVLHKTDEADFDVMTRRVVTPVMAERPLEGIPRIGFAHFCGGVGNTGPKLPLMRAYLNLLRNSIL